ncbi:helix-turn-helix domain-containing protein [Kribbella sp. NPDC020789]
MRTRLAAEQLGAHVTAWRKLNGLTAAQVADRAGITRDTLRKLEHGDPSVGLEVFLNVSRVLGALDRIVEALDPYETDLGRARADQTLPKRVRR